MLNDWITLLTDNNKKKNKTKNKQYGIIRQIKLRYAAKAMNGKSTSRKIDNIIEAISLAPTSSGFLRSL
jgi:hypothetical protein